jgi:hypothetical protein
MSAPLKFRLSAAARAALVSVGEDGGAWRHAMRAGRHEQPLPLSPEKHGPFIARRSVHLHAALFPSALVALGRLQQETSSRSERDALDALLNSLVDADYRSKRARRPSSSPRRETATART